MNKKKYTQIDASLLKPATLTKLSKTVNIRIICKPQYAVSVWSDRKLAKKIVKMGKKKGNDIHYNSKLNIVTQRYKEKTEQEVVDIIKKELKSCGGEIKK